MLLKEAHYDICLLGMGSVGSIVALLLQSLPLKIVIIARSNTCLYGGVILNVGSWSILNHLGIRVPYQPIHCIHVSEYKKFGVLQLDLQNQEIGFIVHRQDLQSALQQALGKHHVEILLEYEYSIERKNSLWNISYHKNGNVKNITSTCLFIAEGAQSSTREKLPVIVRWSPKKTYFTRAKIGLYQSHAIAHERFVPNGAIALVPENNKTMRMAWVSSQWIDADNITTLLQKFITNPMIQSIENVQTYQFHTFSTIYYDNQLVLLGDSDHLDIPLGAQGLNRHILCAWVLRRMLYQACQNQKPIYTYISHYKKFAQEKRQLIKNIAHIFTSPHWSRWRNIGLTGIEMCPSVKNFFLKHLLGLPIPYAHEY